MVFSCQVMSNYQKKNILFVNELKFSALQTLMCYLKRTMISYINITHWHMIFEIYYMYQMPVSERIVSYVYSVHDATIKLL